MTLDDLFFPVPQDLLPDNVKNQDIFTELLVESDGKISHSFAVVSKDAWKLVIPSFGDKVSVIEFSHIGEERHVAYLYICNRHNPSFFKRIDDVEWHIDSRNTLWRGDHSRPE